MSLALSVRNVSKSYTIAKNQERESTLAETMLKKLRNPFARVEKETFWALKDVSFDVQQGEVLGIIGRNGAGKSTLLKILSRITEPTDGEIDLYGRVGSLLEVGTGFHPELTGRENIFLNGAILGMSRAEIKKQFDAIVDFAGVEKFLDTPVKRYSSGMYVRLAFAVAAHLRSEILIIDEVLAVGDAEFQKKCLGKMQDVAHDGRTVLFVSHNMAAVRGLCASALLLDEGRLAMTGRSEHAVAKYMSTRQTESVDLSSVRRSGTGEIRLVQASSAKWNYLPDEPKTILYRIQRKSEFTSPVYLSALIVDGLGHQVAQFDSRLYGFLVYPCESFVGALTIRSPWLKPGTYYVNLYICSAGVIDCVEAAVRFDVAEVLPYPSTTTPDATQSGLVLSEFEWSGEAQ